MSRETPESNAETRGHLLGISTGWSEAADWLKEQAGKSFLADNDDEARLLRSFAQFARRTSGERRTEYEKYKNEECTCDGPDHQPCGPGCHYPNTDGGD